MDVEPQLRRYLVRGRTFEQWRSAWVRWDARYTAGVDWRVWAERQYWAIEERKAG